MKSNYWESRIRGKGFNKIVFKSMSQCCHV